MKKSIALNHLLSPPARIIVLAAILGSMLLVFSAREVKADDVNAALLDCYSGTFMSIGETDKEHNKIKMGNTLTWYIMGPTGTIVTFKFEPKDTCLGVSPFKYGVNPISYTKTSKDYKVDQFKSKSVDKGKDGYCYYYTVNCSNLATQPTQSQKTDPIIDVPH